MRDQEIIGLWEAYSSIYEKKEKPEMEGDENKEPETDGSTPHKEGEHPKGKEERGEKKGKEKEDKNELDEDSSALSAAARKRAQEMGAKRRRTPAYKAGGNRGTGRNERAAYNLSNTQRSAAANPDTQRTRSRRPSTEDTGAHRGDYDRFNRSKPEKNPKHEANKETAKESYDLFDYILKHLVAEGYADTNKAALAIMANMSEEWKQIIVEQMTVTDLDRKLNTPAYQRLMKGNPAYKGGGSGANQLQQGPLNRPGSMVKGV